ncbi:hypothetical protein EKO04_001481 [Ascochyta lentis]|uniref:Uncharacterized protein n=1 Tax=Ascochyta lentis TaxID=205686 RepID=A0A8H7JC45_9PLEO|nr:hypothetical protein EKO04_001481 [Ascochyta lentis]
MQLRPRLQQAVKPTGFRKRRQATLKADSEDEEEERVRMFTRIPALEQGFKEGNEEADFQLSIDVGASHTAVAAYKKGEPLDHIPIMDDFPGTTGRERQTQEIETALWYHDQPRFLNAGVEPSEVRLRFGNEVAQISAGLCVPELRRFYNPDSRVLMMKLLLGEKDYSRPARKKLIDTLDHLISLGYIRERSDVLTHFLREVLRVVKVALIRDHGMKEDSSVEVTFTVPVCWRQSSIHTMAVAVEAAMQEIGQTFLMLDAGGLTTDSASFIVGMTEPIRLGAEIAQAKGVMVGSSNLNDAFRDYMLQLLQDETYLLTHSLNTIEKVIDADLVPQFESLHKRTFAGPLSVGSHPHVFPLRGLKASREDSRIRDDMVYLSSDDMWQIFQPTVVEICKLFEDMVTTVRDGGHRIDKFVLAGGFGDSPCLRSCLREKREELNERYKMTMQECYPATSMSATGVATGGILRSVNKEHGPARKPSQSLGIIRHIPVEHSVEEYEAEVLQQESREFPPEKAWYIYDTIRWILKVNTGLLPPVYRVRFMSDHIFPHHKKIWIIKEHFYASDTCNEDHYQLSHEKNKDKVVKIGFVQVDITPMKHNIQSVLRERKLPINKVSIEIEMIVIDLFLKFNAYWDGSYIEGSCQSLSIVSAFEPGVK